MRAASLLALALAGAVPSSFAAIHTCTDDQGRTVFRDSPCLRDERAAPSQPGSRAGDATAREGDASTASTLAPKQVTRTLDRLDQAMARRNAKAVTALLARDARVHWKVQGSAADKRAMDRAGYAEYLRQAFARKDYAYTPESARVSLSKREPRATATRTLRETLLLDGRLRMAQVREKVTLAADGGEVVVLALRREAMFEGGR